MVAKVHMVLGVLLDTNEKDQAKCSSSYVRYDLNQMPDENSHIYFNHTKEQDSLLTLIHLFCCF